MDTEQGEEGEWTQSRGGRERGHGAGEEESMDTEQEEGEHGHGAGGGVDMGSRGRRGVDTEQGRERTEQAEEEREQGRGMDTEQGREWTQSRGGDRGHGAGEGAWTQSRERGARTRCRAWRGAWTQCNAGRQ